MALALMLGLLTLVFAAHTRAADFCGLTDYQNVLFVPGHPAQPSSVAIFGGSVDGPSSAQFKLARSSFGMAVESFTLDTRMRITPDLPNPGRYNITWVAPAGLFILESTASLNAPVWTPAPEGVSSAQGFNTVNLLASGPRRFFRLRKI